MEVPNFPISSICFLALSTGRVALAARAIYLLFTALVLLAQVARVK